MKKPKKPKPISTAISRAKTMNTVIKSGWNNWQLHSYCPRLKEWHTSAKMKHREALEAQRKAIVFDSLLYLRATRQQAGDMAFRSDLKGEARDRVAEAAARLGIEYTDTKGRKA